MKTPFLGKNSRDQRERALAMLRQHRLSGGPAAPYHKPVKILFLGKNSSDQRERVPAIVRQHRLVGGPAAPRNCPVEASFKVPWLP